MEKSRVEAGELVLRAELIDRAMSTMAVPDEDRRLVAVHCCHGYLSFFGKISGVRVLCCRECAGYLTGYTEWQVKDE